MALTPPAAGHAGRTWRRGGHSFFAARSRAEPATEGARSYPDPVSHPWGWRSGRRRQAFGVAAQRKAPANHIQAARAARMAPSSSGQDARFSTWKGGFNSLWGYQKPLQNARVAQWIRASASEAEGRRFEPCRERQHEPDPVRTGSVETVAQHGRAPRPGRSSVRIRPVSSIHEFRRATPRRRSGNRQHLVPGRPIRPSWRAVEKWLSRLAHNQENVGSNPTCATINARLVRAEALSRNAAVALGQGISWRTGLPVQSEAALLPAPIHRRHGRAAELESRGGL